MAAIFQIRRGTTDISSSIFDGELYLNKSKNSLQVSIGDGNPITLLPLNTASVGDVHLHGNITASNAYFSGDVAISGNLFLGNNSSDNIAALGVFTTNLVAGTTNTYDIGTTSAVWANVYANNVSASSITGAFSGNINDINITTFSQSVDNRLDQLETNTGSQDGRITVLENKATTLQTYTASVDSRLNQLSNDTGSQNSRLNNLQATSASLLIETANLETFTASINNAIDVTGGNTRIKGNLIVDGTQTSLNTTETFIEDKSITLASGSTTSGIADGAGFNIAGANVSMSWQDSNTRLFFNTNIAALGSISSSTIVGLNNASVSTYSTSVDSRLSNLQTTSGSVNNSILLLNGFTSSATIRLNNLESTSASLLVETSNLELFSASALLRLNSLEADTGSQNTRITVLENKTTTLAPLTSSILSFTSSANNRLSRLEESTASLNTFTGSTYSTFSQSVDLRLDGLEYTASISIGAGLTTALNEINAFTASATIRLNNLETTSASVNSRLDQLSNDSGSQNTRITTLETKANTLATVTSSLLIETANLELFSSSALLRLNSLETDTGSQNTRITTLETKANTLATVTSSLLVETANLETFSASALTRLSALEVAEANLESFTSSINTTIKTRLNAEGVISGSIQVLGGSTIHSGSAGDYQFNSIGVGTAPSNVGGEIRAAGDITAFYSSDSRLKYGVVPIENALQKVESISGNRYHWKEGFEDVHSHKGSDVGVIAQEIQNILPEVVTERDSGYLAVNYEKLVPLLIEAIKELSLKVKQLENK